MSLMGFCIVIMVTCWILGCEIMCLNYRPFYAVDRWSFKIFDLGILDNL